MTTTRLARASDAAAIAGIYNQGIADRGATFETAPRSAADIAQRIQEDPVRYPVIVAEDADAIAGWASIGSYRERSCYAGIGEFSVYVERGARGRGVGRALLAKLVEEARQRGYWKLLSRVFTFNTASLTLCRSLGFREVGRYEKHGRLDGKWLDVVIVERLLPENQPADEGGTASRQGTACGGDPEGNKALVRRLLADVDRGVDVVDLYYAPDYVDHTPSPVRGLAAGREGVRQAFAVFQQAFPDTRHTIEDLVAEGDRVVARITARGTHTGEIFGHAPTRKVVTLTGITIYRIVEGRILERWAVHGPGVLDQLGIAVTTT